MPLEDHFPTFAFILKAPNTCNHPHFLSPWENISNVFPSNYSPFFCSPLYQCSLKDESILASNVSLPILPKIYSYQALTAYQNCSYQSHLSCSLLNWMVLFLFLSPYLNWHITRNKHINHSFLRKKFLHSASRISHQWFSFYVTGYFM